jgi:hypothetical protein
MSANRALEKVIEEGHEVYFTVDSPDGSMYEQIAERRGELRDEYTMPRPN